MSTPFTRPIIERARALIADEAQWCRAALARDERGWQTDPTDATVRLRRVGGCGFRARGRPEAGPQSRRCGCERPRGPSSLINTNDSEGHAAVLALFDKALAAI